MKTTTMKKWVSLLLVVLMLSPTLPVKAVAAEDGDLVLFAISGDMVNSSSKFSQPFTLTQESRLTLRVESEISSFSYSVYDNSGKEVTWGFYHTNEAIAPSKYIYLSSGEYVFEIKNYTSKAASFTATVNCDTLQKLESDASALSGGTEFRNATPVALNVMYGCMFTQTQQNLYYSFYLPALTDVTLETNTSSVGSFTIEICDENMVELRTFYGSGSTSENKQTVRTYSLPAGLYYLHMKSNNTGTIRFLCSSDVTEPEPIDDPIDDPVIDDPIDDPIVEPEPYQPVTPSTNFADVPAGSYYETPVKWAVANGITSGRSATTFDPYGVCTRAEAVTFLYRAYGKAMSSGYVPFVDLAPGAYYITPVAWAVDNNITSGTSANTFSPANSCSRGQIVTFLFRASGGANTYGNATNFVDVPQNAYYAAAVTWAAGRGITNGTSATTFSPDAPCTRAQIVTFLYNAFH